MESHRSSTSEPARLRRLKEGVTEAEEGPLVLRRNAKVTCLGENEGKEKGLDVLPGGRQSPGPFS